MATPRLILAGFAPYGGRAVNPAEAAVRRAGASVAADEATVETVVLPVSYARAWPALRACCEQGSAPTAVVAFGQAAGRAHIAVERLAINLADAAEPDDDGCVRREEPLADHAAPARWGRLPVGALVAALRELGLPAAPSTSAGTYVCNALMWDLLGWADAQPDPPHAGFVHLPLLPEQASDGSEPTLPLASQAEAVVTVARTLLRSG